MSSKKNINTISYLSVLSRTNVPKDEVVSSKRKRNGSSITDHDIDGEDAYQEGTMMVEEREDVGEDDSLVVFSSNKRQKSKAKTKTESIYLSEEDAEEESTPIPKKNSKRISSSKKLDLEDADNAIEDGSEDIVFKTPRKRAKK